jgi:hypothetical protein
MSRPTSPSSRNGLKQILPGENIEVRTANDGIVLSGTVILDRQAGPRAGSGQPLCARPGVEPDGGGRHAAGDAEGPLRRDAALGVEEPVRARWLQDLGHGRRRIDRHRRSARWQQLSTYRTAVRSPGTKHQGRAWAWASTSARWNSRVLLEALESKGMVRTLAEPNLTALSGQEAKFLAGGEYPIPVAAGQRRDHHRIQALRRRAELHPGGGRRRYHQPDDQRGRQLDRHHDRAGIERLHDQRLQAARNLDHGRDARRRKLCHRGPAAGRLPRPERPGAVAGRRADPGRAVPQSAEYQRASRNW